MILTLLLSSLTIAKVPNVVLNEQVQKDALVLSSPIAQVTLFSDRALIEREVKKKLKAGTHVVRFSDLTGLLLEDSLRVEAKGAQIYRLEKKLVERSDFELEDLQAAIIQAEQLQDRINLLTEERSRYRQEINTLKKIKPASFVPEQKRQSPISYDTSTWVENASFFTKEISWLQEKIRTIDVQLEELQREKRRLAVKSKPLLSSNSKKKFEVVAVVDVPKETTVRFVLSYFTPNSSWYPTYDVHYDSTNDSVWVEQAALIRQNSGESWEDVKIDLSTSIPSRTLDLPKLKTWTLGEKEEYIPQAQHASGSGLDFGLFATYYQLSRNISSIPNIASLKPTKTEVVHQVLFNEQTFGTRGLTDTFVAVYEGKIRIERGGVKQFGLASDDGSRLYINGKRVVNNDGLHGVQTVNGSIPLSPGYYDLRIEYFQNRGGNQLRFLWNEGGGWQVVPQDVLFYNSSKSKSLFSQPVKTATKEQLEAEARLEVYHEQVAYFNSVMSKSSKGQSTPQDRSLLESLGTKGGGLGTMSSAFSADEMVGGVGYGAKAAPRGKSRGPNVRSAKSSKKSSMGQIDSVAESFSEPTSSLTMGIEAENTYSSPVFSSPDLPAAQSRGVAYIYEAQGEFSIPSVGEEQRIPVDAFGMKTQAYYETVPALEEMAYLKATLFHEGELPILKGSANIFLNGQFNTQGLLDTAVQGTSLEVPLGADENIRIKRNIAPSQRKEGFLGSSEVTDYQITIDIGNYKNSDIRIRVIDQIPKTNNGQIHIADVSSSHSFAKEPDADGILFWELDIPAQQTTKITLQYSITRPKNWVLWGN
ncbi:MAG: hypothetical protein CMK59_08595 [Proteobacteria bacterium]|nr:hypothetical protein [Pseudomonadota bacterium]